MALRLAAASLALIGVAGCEAPQTRDEPPAPSPAMVEAPALPPPMVEVVPPPAPALAPGSDEPPARPSTLAESKLHAPHWAHGELEEIEPKERRAIFERLGHEPVTLGALEGALIVCRVEGPVSADSVGAFSAPDLTTISTFGMNPTIEQRGDEDERVMFTSMALATLAPGDTIRARIIDREFGDPSTLGVVKGTYRGTLPWTARAGRLAVECRALAGTALTKALAVRLAACDEVLASAASRTSFDPTIPDDFGFFYSGLAGTRAELEKPAALVGFADPRVLRRLDWERRIEQRFFDQAAPFVARTVATAPPPTTMVPIVAGSFQGRVDGFTCGPKALTRKARLVELAVREVVQERGGCVLRLEIESLGKDILEVRPSVRPAIDGIAQPHLVLASGESVPLEPLALEGWSEERTRELRPGTKGTALLIPVRHFTPSEALRPALLTTGPKEGAARVLLRID